MGTIKAWNKWANAHTYYGLDLVRAALGVFLILKGVNFMSDAGAMALVMDPFRELPGSMMIIHYVAAAHFVGGFFIIIGLLTRWSVALQIPILLGAILTNFLGVMILSNLIQAVVVFLVCGFFIFYGSGKHSLDYYLKMQK
ncbi:MAG: DoxX family protein [Muriicola sp.]|nr:DoxX family protein [Muriicola sp.]NNK10051.1 DoxX family protein [Flavobacteriaceae bacterium]